MTCRHRYDNGTRCATALGANAQGVYCPTHAGEHPSLGTHARSVDVTSNLTVRVRSDGRAGSLSTDGAYRRTWGENCTRALAATEHVITATESRLRDLRAVRGALLNSIEDGTESA